MTNVSKPEKMLIRNQLKKAAEDALREQGWAVEKVQGTGKSSVRRISRGGVEKLATIRTTQDQWIAFPRDAEDKKWLTLADVDVVVASSVDDKDEPRQALVHIFDADEVRARFDRAYDQRLAAGHSIPVGRGMWVPLYQNEDPNEPSRVGAGLGNLHPPVARTALNMTSGLTSKTPSYLTRQQPELVTNNAKHIPATPPAAEALAPLTIAEAKQRLAAALGVSPDNVKIIVES